MGKLLIAVLVTANARYAFQLDVASTVGYLFLGTVFIFYVVPASLSLRSILRWIFAVPIGALAKLVVALISGSFPYPWARHLSLLALASILATVAALAPFKIGLVAAFTVWAMVLLIQMRWAACEDQRSAIAQRLRTENPEKHPDMLFYASYSALLLFPIFSIFTYRLYMHGFLPGLVTPESSWQTFALIPLDQFLKAFIFDVLEVFDWTGFSGAHITSAPEILNLERLLFCVMRLSFAGIVINAFVRIREISRSTSDTKSG